MGSHKTAGMMKLSIGMVAALSLLGVAGCKKKGGAAGEAMAKMEEFSKAMCDCKDKACADKVNADMTKWGTEMAKNAKPGDAEKPDPDMAKKSADIMTKYTECMTKLMMAGAGGGDMKGGDTKGGDMAGAKPAGKSCEDMGGKKVGDDCQVKDASAVFDVVPTGKFDTDMMHPEPGAVFKITNKLDVPVSVNTIYTYAYDKGGAQVDMEFPSGKSKNGMNTKGGLVELKPKETKEYVSEIQKKYVPNAETIQAEITAWEIDGKRWVRDLTDEQKEKRPKDGWK
jgi:hypothetical protein